MAFDISEELQRLRKEFHETVDKGSLESLRAWFVKYDYFTLDNHAMIAGVDYREARRLRRSVGISKANFKWPPKPKQQKRTNTLIVPPDWKNREWLAGALVHYTKHEIAAAAGVTYGVVEFQRKKFNLKCPRRHCDHPCCNRAWIEKHYIKEVMTITECSRLAGVSKYVFRRWLLHFEYQTRATPISLNAIKHNVIPECPLWSRKLVAALERQPIVRRVKLLAYGVRVFYTTFNNEYFWYNQKRSRKRACMITEESARLERIPEVLQQYPEPFSESQYPHLCIPQNQWQAASTVEQHLALQYFIAELHKINTYRLRAPDKVMRRELERLRQLPIMKFYNDGSLWVNGSRSIPTCQIVPHFFDIGPKVYRILRHRRYLGGVLKRMSKYSHRLNTAWVIRFLCSYTGRNPCPTLYVALLSLLNVSGPVLDLHPDYGARAIACALMGLKYYTIPTPESNFEQAIGEGFGEFIGLDWAHYQGERVDLVISDHNQSGSDPEAALRYAGKARHIVAFIPKKSAQESRQRLPSRAELPVRSNLNHNPDYYFVW